MSLSPGTRLGPYEILSPLGAGGMGEVYRARDTRLGREVAVKLLPEDLAHDPARVARFEREARSASALSHANVVAVYDVGREGESSYLVTEIVEGGTLRDQLDRGLMPVRRLLDLSAQIASGLSAAHERGIVHRDLKPENILLTRGGEAKIADFGLAKVTGPAEETDSSLPTSDGWKTTDGLVLGTIGYMSPEQAAGRKVDFRSDQFSLGTILYEMAAGKRPFQRATPPETLVAILREEPEPVRGVSPQVPAALGWIVERCLAKEPEERYDSTKDLARDLRAVQTHLSEASGTQAISAVSGKRAGRSKRSLAGAAVILAAGAVVGAAGYRWLGGAARKPSEPPSFRQITFQRGNILHARFAPDGQSIVYSAAWEGKPTEIFSTRIGSTEFRSLGFPKSDLAAISGNGDLLLLRKTNNLTTPVGMGTLARADLSGGTARDLAENVHGAGWLARGEIVLTRHLGGGQDALEYPPSTRRLEYSGSPPRVSRDGRFVAVERQTATGNELLVLDRSGKKAWSAPGAAESLAWHPNGELWYSRSSGENAGVFARGPRLPARTVLEASGWVLHDVAADGRLLMERGVGRRSVRVRLAGDSSERELSWLDGSSLTGLSSDWRRLLFSETEEAGSRSGGVYVRGTDGSPAVRIADGRALALSEDGAWAFVQAPGQPYRYAFVPTGVGESRPVDFGGSRVESAVFLPGTSPRVVATAGESARKGRLEIVTAAGHRPLGISPGFFENSVASSPNGSSIAYRSADHEISICRLEPSHCERRAIESPEASPIQWSDDGRVLYLSDSGEIPAHIVRYEIATGRATPWLSVGPDNPGGWVSLARISLSRDGRSFAYNAFEVRESNLFVVSGLR